MRSILYSAYLHASGRSRQLAVLKTLRREQFDPVHEAEQKHRSRVAGMLRFSLGHVPYYREIFSRLGLGAGDIDARPLEVLRALPLLDRSTLRTRFDALKAENLDSCRWFLNSTGGSTGEPVKFVQDARFHQDAMAGKALFDEWSGYFSGMPKVILWGSERDFLMGKASLRSRLGGWARNEHPLNTFRMSEADMARHVDVINRVRPVQILAYVESAHELARFIENKNLEVLASTSVMTSAGTLYPHVREVIERVFRSTVFDRYGSREVGDAACECERHRGLHVNMYSHHLEILREDGSPCVPGEAGELVVTLLTNRAMPLLRYRTGDMASWAEHPCDCGRGWPMLKGISGRVNSIIRTGQGAFDSVALSTLLYFKDPERKEPFASFGRYQLVQEEPERFALRVVVHDPRLWEQERPTLLDKLQRTLGASVQIAVQTVPEIEPSPSGKHQFIWSELE